MDAIAVGGAESALASSAELSRLWGAVFAEPPFLADEATIDAFEMQRLRRHATLPGFAIAIAREGDAIIGFVYGSTGRSESWWSGYLRGFLEEDVIQRWIVGSFEVTELAVSASHRGRGIGRALLVAILEGRHELRAVLQTRDQDLPARRLYLSLDFRRLAGLGHDALFGRELRFDA